MKEEQGMTLKRLILSLLTILVVVQVVGSLLASWGIPQVSSRLQLYQTDLLLQAAALKPSDDLPADELSSVQNALLGKEPLATALKQYQDVQKEAIATLKQLKQRPTEPNATAEAAAVLALAQQQQNLIHQLDLRIGILQAEQNQAKSALDTWNNITAPPLDETAAVLAGLWQEPPQIYPNAEPQIQQTLDGWFRNRGLSRLFTLQQRTESLDTLATQEQAIAQNTFIKLALIGVMPVIGGVAGVILLISLIVQRVLKGLDSLLAQNGQTGWAVPWDWEIIWQVFIVGFFFTGQFVLARLLRSLAEAGFGFSPATSLGQSLSVLTSYVLMATATLAILYISIKPHLPLPEGWFQLRSKYAWLLWGLGGFLVALPLVIVVSWVNQQIWQGEGGSNPLLQIVLEERNPLAFAIFFFTAAIAAPVFEEILFRGFLLPSLTRYVPVTGAIALSSLIFAVAHLSLAEVLPLAVLGVVLGVVYTRSRSLLSSIVLHSLWNSSTMISLFILGSGTAS